MTNATEHNLLTHSRLSAFRTCPRKHELRYERALRPIRQAAPLRFGHAVHVGLDLRAQGHSREESIDLACAGYDTHPAWASTPELRHEWEVERASVSALLNGYFWFWEDRADLPPSLTPIEVVESERSFRLPILNPETSAPTRSFEFAGKRDKVVRLGDGRLAVMEHKTTSDDIDAGSDYWLRLRIDHQISGYVIAARHDGHEVETVLYDVIRKPTIRPRSIPVLDENGFKVVFDQNGERVFLASGKPRESADSAKGWTMQTRLETPEEYAERLAADIGERPGFYYSRQEIPRLECDLEEFREDLWQQQQAIREAQRKGRWYRNSNACLIFGTCEYFHLCATGFDPDSGVIPPGFEVVADIHPELGVME